VNLSTRSNEPEELDQADPATYRLCLTELDFINRITLTHRPTLHWLDQATKDWPAGATISVLDVGCGHGDLLRAIAGWAKRRGFKAILAGIDLDPRCAEIACQTTPPDMRIYYMTSDVFDYHPACEFDFVVSSQFTHHLTDDQVVRFLRWVDTNTRRGWHIADLNRNVLAYRGFEVFARLMGLHRITRSDGLTSIARSFRRSDWKCYLAAASVRARVDWHPSFRYCVSRIHTMTSP
jgi:2-polyprenyl-3-methyl-5-hydroxy-6-metoxy-1,4-benzoquinol methylase